jgi:hypothetical protein
VLAVIALAAIPAIPGAASAQMKIIAIQAKVAGTTYGVSPDQEEIPVAAGDRVRIDLVGTSIEGGRGVERPVNASFNVASGRAEIVQTGASWVVVNVRSGGDAQIGYTVRGSYDLRGSIASGTILLSASGGGSGSRGGSSGRGGNRGGGGRSSARWDRAQELAELLYTGIYGEDPHGEELSEETRRIYDDGSAGVRAVARSMARDAEEDGGMSQDEAVSTLGDLYRDLLQRDQDDEELWNRDRGFRGNVETLRREGLERIVDVIVTSDEFRSVNKLGELDRLPRGGRGDDEDDDGRL